MTLHLFVLFVCFFVLTVACLWDLYRSHHDPPHSNRKLRSLVPRRLRPRSPLACPVCCRSAAGSSGHKLSPLAVRTWREIKSRRGPPKRVLTEGFARPNAACQYAGITDAQIHALVGDGSHGRAERIQTFRCQACRTTFSARIHTPLYRLKTPSYRVALVLSALAEGLDLSAAERVFGIRHATITTWLVRAGAHAQNLHERSFRQLVFAHVQLDELRTRLRRATQVLWLWVAIDPLSKCIPVLELGPRTHHMAQLLIHALREKLAPDCLPVFTSDGLTAYFYALTAHFGEWLKGDRRRRTGSQWQVAADLLYGQVYKRIGDANWSMSGRWFGWGQSQPSQLLCKNSASLAE